MSIFSLLSDIISFVFYKVMLFPIYVVSLLFSSFSFFKVQTTVFLDSFGLNIPATNIAVRNPTVAIDRTTSIDDILSYILSLSGNSTPSSVLDAFLAIQDPVIRHKIIILSIGAAMNIKGVINDTATKVIDVIPDTWMIGSTINFSMFSMLGHMIFTLDSSLGSPKFKEIKSIYQNSIGGAENLIVFGESGNVAGKPVRTDILKQWAARMVDIPNAKLYVAMYSNAPELFPTATNAITSNFMMMIRTAFLTVVNTVFYIVSLAVPIAIAGILYRLGFASLLSKQYINVVRYSILLLLNAIADYFPGFLYSAFVRAPNDFIEVINLLFDVFNIEFVLEPVNFTAAIGGSFMNGTEMMSEFENYASTLAESASGLLSEAMKGSLTIENITQVFSNMTSFRSELNESASDLFEEVLANDNNDITVEDMDLESEDVVLPVEGKIQDEADEL